MSSNLLGGLRMVGIRQRLCFGGMIQNFRFMGLQRCQ